MVATKSGGDLRKTSNSTIHHLAMVATKSGGDLCKTSNHNHPPSGDGGYGERWSSSFLIDRSLFLRPENGGQCDGPETCCDQPVLGHLFEVVLGVQLGFHERWKSSVAES